MAECKECGNRLHVTATKCPACGWEKPQSRLESRGYDATVHGCAFEELGQRCANAGSLAEATSGGGPWWCRQHFPAFRGWSKKRDTMPANWRAKLPPQMRNAAVIADSVVRHVGNRAENDVEF